MEVRRAAHQLPGGKNLTGRMKRLYLTIHPDFEQLPELLELVLEGSDDLDAAVTLVALGGAAQALKDLRALDHPRAKPLAIAAATREPPIEHLQNAAAEEGATVMLPAEVHYQPLAIRHMKRFIMEQEAVEETAGPPGAGPRVAIIGAGPCGLTAAQDLCVAGYGVTVFEALPVAGGMLRVGVPEYRLPAQVIDREVQDIVDLGVDLRLNTCVDNLDDVFARGFKAVLIAVGAHEGVRLPVPGAPNSGRSSATSLRARRAAGPAPGAETGRLLSVLQGRWAGPGCPGHSARRP